MPIVDDEEFINRVLKVVESRPGITTKEIVAAFKNKGESATRKEVNSCLYQLQNRGKVKKVTSSSDTAPQWYSSTDHENLIGKRTQDSKTAEIPTKKPATETWKKITDVFTTQIAEKDIEFSFGYRQGSPNDPHVEFEFIGEKLVCSINSKHPLVAELIADPHSQPVLEVFLGMDALIQRQLSLDETSLDLIGLREQAFRQMGSALKRLQSD